MIIRQDLLKEAQEIFKDWEKRDEKDNENAVLKANKLLNKEKYEDIYASWDAYIKHEARNEQDLKDFLLGLFSIFKIERKELFKVPYPFDPYDFAGFILAKIDVEKNWEYAGDIPLPLIMDALSIPEEQYTTYDYWNDPKVIEASKKYL